jgi:hypothetical protein
MRRRASPNIPLNLYNIGDSNVKKWGSIHVKIPKI